MLASSPKQNSRGHLDFIDKGSTLNSTNHQSAEHQAKKMLTKKVKRYEKEVTSLKGLVRSQEVKLADNAERIRTLEKDLQRSAK